MKIPVGNVGRPNAPNRKESEKKRNHRSESNNHSPVYSAKLSSPQPKRQSETNN
jgi:hypothetical protein